MTSRKSHQPVKSTRPPARIADLGSTNTVSFSSARTRKRFLLSRYASAIQIVRPSTFRAETQPKLQPALLRLSAIISDTSRAHECVERILESPDKPGHRKFIYPVIAAVTAPALTFAPPAFFGRIQQKLAAAKINGSRPFAHAKNSLLAGCAKFRSRS
jgi:hypothetical protein